MSDEQPKGATVVPLRAADAASAVAFDEGRPDGAAYLDTTGTEKKRRDIIPEHLTRGRLPETLAAWAGKTSYQARFHAIRVPWYAVWFTFLGGRGAYVLSGRLKAWWGAEDLRLLESQAVAAGRAAHHEAMRAHTEGKKTRGARGRIVGVTAASAVVVLLAAWKFAPHIVFVPLLAAGGYVLVRHGKPDGKPIIAPAILPDAFTVPTPEVITRAFASLGVDKISAWIKEHGTMEWVSDVHRDGDGWGVDLNLPYGVTAKMIIQRRAQLASGLRRPLSAVWPEAVPDEHEGRLFLWIGRHDLAKVRPPAHPLLKAGTCDVFQNVPLATIPRGTAVTVPLFETNWLIGASPGNGKALALDTPVPIPSGWTTMGELRDGDVVFGADGRPCTVITAWPVRHDRPCYEVEFSDGTVITADADHLWLVDSRGSRVSAQRRAALARSPWTQFSRDQSHRFILPAVMNTADMAASQRTKEGRVNYSVRVASPLQAADADLPVPPYTLGAWLGDGKSEGGLIFSADPEVIMNIESEGEICAQRIAPPGKCPEYRVDGLTTRLRHLGLLRNKHIPVRYLRASEAQRRALLAGLLDTDGTCSKAGEITFSVTSETLAGDVRHLVASLGYKVSMRSRAARLYGKDCGTAWQFHLTPSDKVFRLPRKLSRQVTKTRPTAGRRYITAIRPVSSVPVRCITVDSPDSLYLVSESCIPTHNTAAVRDLGVDAALDVACDLWIHELAGKGDLAAFEQVGHRYCSGLDDESVEYAARSATMLRTELKRRSDIFKKIPKERRPDGKLTRELAMADRRLRPVVAIWDEVQNMFLHPEYGADAADDLAYVMRLGRAYGIVVVLATQRPDKECLPTQISGLVQARFCMKVGDYLANDMILGTGAYKAGFSAVEFRQSVDAGLGWLRGTGDAQAVKTYYMDLNATAKVCARARTMRQAAGALSGYALGEDGNEQQPRSFAADVLAVFGGDAKLWCSTIAERLRTQIPGVYADVTAAAVSSQLREIGVEVKNVREPSSLPNLGCERAAVERVVRPMETADA